MHIFNLCNSFKLKVSVIYCTMLHTVPAFTSVWVQTHFLACLVVRRYILRGCPAGMNHSKDNNIHAIQQQHHWCLLSRFHVCAMFAAYEKMAVCSGAWLWASKVRHIIYIFYSTPSLRKYMSSISHRYALSRFLSQTNNYCNVGCIRRLLETSFTGSIVRKGDAELFMSYLHGTIMAE